MGKRGQSTIEYAVLIMLIIAALITVGTYFRRGVQGRWKQAVDDLGQQYDPRYMNSEITHTVVGNIETSVYTVDGENEAGNKEGYWTLREDTSTITDTTTGSSRVAATNQFMF